MRSLSGRFLFLAGLIVSAVPLVMGATITGTVKGPGGAPFEGAFVEARNTTTNVSTDVLSHANGSYMVPNLPAGTYQLTIRAIGYKAAPQSETIQTADQHAKADFALEKRTVTWSDLSVWQGQMLFPKGPGRNLVFGPRGTEGGPCFACHNFQSRMATRRLNHQGWLRIVNYMQDVVISPYFPLPPLNKRQQNLVAAYLTQVFGPNSDLPPSPADLPGYKATVRKFKNEAMDIVYVVYSMPDPNWLPFQMYPPAAANGLPSDGSIWVADFGNANQVDQIDPVTGKARVYRVSCPHSAMIHAIEAGPRGDAWFAEAACSRVGRADPRTGKITEYEYNPAKGRGNPHDSHPMLVDGKLYVFFSGTPTRLDPATGKFTPIPGVPNAYDVYQDTTSGNLWFTSLAPNSTLKEVDPKTLKVVMRFAPPTDRVNFRSHRIAIASNSEVWLTCYSNRICRIDPKTKAFKKYTPLGPNQSDYAIGIDDAGGVWYSMSTLDEIQRLDPKTGHIIEYPFPYQEITMRKFWAGTQGKIWWASPANGVVGYFYLAGGNTRAAK
ncbi:MAG TPA: carboxypeptidase regulatory-like domain-containing protein [Patescibacteria group bacterium]|nr:carboxypeptidase regulatory-like domain-containing protein [Patescibacteria group bacterium]